MTPKQVLQMIKDKGVVMVDIKFIDLLGTWQHFSAPVSEFKDEAPFEEGLGFDGSSIRGWQAIEFDGVAVVPARPKQRRRSVDEVRPADVEVAQLV